MVLFVPYVLVWSCTIWYGSVWFCMVPFGPIWHRIAPFGPVWPIWASMAPIGPEIHREQIAHWMGITLDEATDPWGIKVERVEMWVS